MSTLKPSLRSTILVLLLPLLGACAAYQTAAVAPAPSRLVSITTTSGKVLTFDTLPAPRIVGDTVYGSQGGVSYAVPTTEVATTRWTALPPAQPVPGAIAAHDGPTGGEPTAVTAGAHVRVTAPSLGWDSQTGDVTEVHGDTLLVHTGSLLFGRTQPVPFNALTTLEVSRNHGAHVGARIVGGLAGMVAGGLAGDALSGSCPAGTGDLDFAPVGCAIDHAGNVLAGAVAGAALGMIIAAAAVPEVWTTIGLPGVRTSLVPLPGGRLGLGISLAF